MVEPVPDDKHSPQPPPRPQPVEPRRPYSPREEPGAKSYTKWIALARGCNGRYTGGLFFLSRARQTH